MCIRDRADAHLALHTPWRRPGENPAQVNAGTVAVERDPDAGVDVRVERKRREDEDRLDRDAGVEREATPACVKACLTADLQRVGGNREEAADGRARRTLLRQ